MPAYIKEIKTFTSGIQASSEAFTLPIPQADNATYIDIDARVQNISPPQPGTCEWFFKTTQFQQWYSHSEHNNTLLWIKGNPGTGKSTLTKRILEYCQDKENYIIAAYFFNARGAELEKTPLGMLRSLLYQLLEHEPSLYNQLCLMFRKKQAENNSEGWEWREPELKSFFLSEIPKCQSRPLLLIIDALDECSDCDVQKVADFLQDLSTRATNAEITLNICLSSRHYPFIRFKRYQELVLEKEKNHDEDIITYIHSNLIINDRAIEEAIIEKASGIFMWVVLVITILNRAYDDGKIEAMNQKLNEIPADLGEVFETLLNKNNPDKDETILILQFVLFAKRLLTPEEIYFALIAGMNGQMLGIWDPLLITPDIIRRRIISSSRGLIEIRKGEKETVQFIHKSVDDFLVRNSRLQGLDPALGPDFIAKSNNRLKDCCMSYIMMDSLQLPKNFQDAITISSSYPFLQYASSYLLDHAEEATLVGQTELLRLLKDDRVFKRWERLYNCFVDYNECGRRLNLLHILAARGLHNLVQKLLEGGVKINAQRQPHGTALEAAICHEHEKTVEILLNRGAKTEVRGRLTHRTALEKAINTGNNEILAMLVEKGAKRNILKRVRNGSVVHAAISDGNKDVIPMLLDKGAKVNARGLNGTALQAAVAAGEKEIVEILLDRGAKANARGLNGTALLTAVAAGEEEIVEMLLNKGAEANTRGLLGTALQEAVFEGEKEIIKMLIDKGAKVNAWGGLRGTALQAATMLGDQEILEMLLNKGAKVNTRGLYGTALQGAAIMGHQEIVEILLNKGAKVNARGLICTALQAAAFGGKKEIVEMLLEKGAKINAWGWVFGTALQAAAAARNKEIVEMLLDKGAKVNARGGLYGTALQAAADAGEKEIVEMLLNKGANVNAWGCVFGTALRAAADAGEKEIVEILLNKGANVNARGLYGTALQAAAARREEEIVKMLLEKGAKETT
ncbi:hypothetical protein ACSS6W_001639 [Trichoderma asperelloides]